MNLLGLICMGVGGVLIYGGVRNINPLELVKETLQGNDPPQPGSWDQGDAVIARGFLLGGQVQPFTGFSGRSVWPAQSRTITNGWHVPNPRYEIGYHTGIDISSENGLRIVAPIDGKIIQAAYLPSYGNTVRIRSRDGKVEVWLAHLAAFKPGLVAGRSIAAGTEVGTMGNSGTNSSGVHLHYEARVPPFKYGNDINPQTLHGSR